MAVRNPRTRHTVFLVALLDSGCTGLVVSSSAVEKLKMETWEEVVTIKVLNQTTCNMRKNCLIDLLSLDDAETQFLGRRAIIVESIPVGPESIPHASKLESYSYMRDVKIITPPYLKVDLIISVDMAATWCIPSDFR